MRIGFRGSRHQSMKSRSWVASIAAGDRRVRPVIFLPSVEVMWREISPVTGSPMVPSSTFSRM